MYPYQSGAGQVGGGAYFTEPWLDVNGQLLPEESCVGLIPVQ